MKGLIWASRISIGLTAGWVVCGCSLFPNGLADRFSLRSPHETMDRPPVHSTIASTSSGGATGQTANQEVIGLAFDVLFVDLPIDGIRHSRKVWNHVDELRMDARTVARLGRNGLRVGAGSPDAWPALHAIIDAAKANVRNDQLFTQPGLPLTMRLGSIHDSETFFSYDQENRLVGKTFQRGDELMVLDYAFHPELGGSTDLQISFEIRHDTGQLKWGRSGEAIQQVPDLQRHMFHDLSVQVTLRPAEFLVIGPSDEADNEYLVGSRFFMNPRSGREYETLLCIMPRAYRSGPARPGSAPTILP